jgi:hypothetical protein
MFLWCANIPSDLRTCTKVGLFQVKGSNQEQLRV